jgi:hypothetical protein
MDWVVGYWQNARCSSALLLMAAAAGVVFIL